MTDKKRSAKKPKIKTLEQNKTKNRVKKTFKKQNNKNFTKEILMFYFLIRKIFY